MAPPLTKSRRLYGPDSHENTNMPPLDSFSSAPNGPGLQTSTSSEPFAAGSSSSFDILEWHEAYKSCQLFFLDHAQHETGTEALAALINIKLPHQWLPPIVKSTKDATLVASSLADGRPSSIAATPTSSFSDPKQVTLVSLIPYIRRLVITGMDEVGILHGLFGADWRKGIGPLHECERRNLLFAAKSVGWAHVKSQYDMDPQQTVPFMKPPSNVLEVEISNAERVWGEWLAMEDWMVGPRAPDADGKV